VLAVDFLEALRGLPVVVLRVQQIQALVIELVGRVIRDHIFLAEKAAGRQSRNDQRERGKARCQHP